MCVCDISLNHTNSTKEAIERVAYEYCEDMKRQNVLYFELRYNPTLGSLDPEDYIEGVLAGTERGERDFGVKCRHIFGFMREHPGELRVKLNLLG